MWLTEGPPPADASPRSTLPPLPSGVPAQFLGMARDLRNAVAAIDGTAYRAAWRIATDLRDRLSRRRRLRPEHPAEAARQWRAQMPATGRLWLDIRTTSDSIAVDEIRLIGDRFRQPGWRTPEDSLLLGLVRLRATSRPCAGEMCLMPLGLVSLHALGRRYQRGFDNSTAAVMSDILAIATQSTGLDAAGQEVRIGVPDGAWCGQMVMAGHGENGRPFLISAIRTFK
jgi:hypothetical protein